MNSKRSGDIVELITLLALMIYYYGYGYTFNIIFNFFKMMNTILIEAFDSSLLSYIFKYGITFTIVGFLLFKMNSPRGKIGYIIGKTLYAIVGVIVAYILNLISKCIFQ